MAETDPIPAASPTPTEDEARNAARPVLTAGWRALNDRHAGEDVYILGASPQLASLTASQLDGLGRAVVVGGNRTYYRAPLTYLLSAYPPEIAIAGRHLDRSRLIHIKKPHEPPLSEPIVSVTRRIYCDGLGLNRRLSDPLPVLYTRRNQALAMLHLAIVMGAGRAIFVGVDQSSYAYFWQYDEVTRTRMRDDYRRLLADPPANGVVGYVEESLALLDQPAGEREALPYYEDFAPIFAEYIRQASALGVEVVATLPGSVVHRAGAQLQPLDDCLAGRPAPRPRRPRLADRMRRALAPLSAVRTPGVRSAAPAGYEPPLLISGLDDGRERLAEALRARGVAVGSPGLWRDRGARAVTALAVRSPQFRQVEPTWDFPEPLVETLERRDEGALEVITAVRRALSAPELVADVASGRAAPGPDLTLWTLQRPWGWASPFDAALAQALDYIFPGLRFVHVAASDPDRLAGELVRRFEAGVAGRAVERDAAGGILAVDGKPVRQMQLLRARGEEADHLHGRFTLRCADQAGARGLIEAFERIAAIAAARFGPDRAIVVSGEDADGGMDAVSGRVAGLLEG
jgi:hypothetical protein